MERDSAETEEVLKAANRKMLYEIYTEAQLITMAKELGIPVVTKRVDKNEITRQIMNAPDFVLKTVAQIDERYREQHESRRVKAYDRAKNTLWKKSLEVHNPHYEEPCLNFTGATSGNGYGTIGIANTQYPTHIASYSFANNIVLGEIPKVNEDKKILYVCHGQGCSKLCVQPSHLTLKTVDDNNYADKIRDGTHTAGEKHYRSSITDEQAKAIKHSKGEGTQAQRALRFEVSVNVIEHIDDGTTWAHIPDKDGNITGRADRQKDMDRNSFNKKHKVFTDEDWKKMSEVIQRNSVKRQLAEGFTECWIWMDIDTAKHGTTTYCGIGYKTHVMSMEAQMKRRRDPENLENEKVLHKCNVKACCNPDHLYLGNNSDITIDAINAGRKNVKLCEKQVLEIRKAVGLHKDIAKLYGISRRTVGDIKQGRRWSRIKDPEEK